MTRRAFNNGILEIRFEHMTTIFAMDDVGPEMDIAAFDGQYSALDQEISHFFSGLFTPVR